jgi:hypothetical protein
VNYPNSTTTPTTAPQVRSGNAATCVGCGQTLKPKRHSRRQKFCSNACRQTAKRAKKWDSRSQTLGATRSVQNPPTITEACKGENEGPRSPFKPIWQVDAGPVVTLANLILPTGQLPHKPILTGNAPSSFATRDCWNFLRAGDHSGCGHDRLSRMGAEQRRSDQQQVVGHDDRRPGRLHL